MERFVPGIRNGARACIVRDGCILLLEKQSPAYGARYALPGGSQDLGETLEAALNRECEEEIGTAVAIVDLVHVADYFKPREDTPGTYRHNVEFFFLCEVPGSYEPRCGSRPDKHQVGVRWVPFDALQDAAIAPQGLRSLLPALIARGGQTYLGRIA